MDKKLTNLKINRNHDMAVLQTESFHHQFVALEGLAVKRYVKTILGALTALRIDYWNSRDVRPDGFLEVYLKTNAKDWDRSSPIQFRYEDNVIELYTEEDVLAFEKKNRILLESGTLVPYVDGYAYHYNAQHFDVWEMKDKDGNVVATGSFGKDFRLEEITEPFQHDLKRSPVKRG